MVSWRSKPHIYASLDESGSKGGHIAWYWRFAALLASWMILGGYLILPAAYDEDPRLRFSSNILTIIIVVLMAAGYSFTAILCLVTRNMAFQAEGVFLPTFSSSALGLLTVAYNFAHSERYLFNTSAIISVVLSGGSCLLYGCLYWWTRRRIASQPTFTPSLGSQRQTSYDSYHSSFYSNYLKNMYPTMRANSDPGGLPLSDEEQMKNNWQMLYKNNQPSPSPDASQSTFHIDLPSNDDREPDGPRTPGSFPRSATRAMRSPWTRLGHGRTVSLQDGAQWERVMGSTRPRRESLRAEDAEQQRRGRSQNRERSGTGPRALSREERRREIELGRMS